MSRIPTMPDDDSQPRIDRTEIVSFFEERAKKIDALGPVRAVIYQDKHPDLAERRDVAEKQRIAPLLSLDGSQRLLDVGCGTGRWAQEVAVDCLYYHGIDISDGLVAYAKKHYGMAGKCRFTVASVDDFSLASLGELVAFDRILCTGVLIYLNDDEASSALLCLEAAMAENARAVFREPVGIGNRLTIKDHFSSDLDQTYNAIYRTQGELEQLMRETLFDRGFRLIDSGDVFDEQTLNNRAETRQRWFVVERSA